MKCKPKDIPAQYCSDCPETFDTREIKEAICRMDSAINLLAQMGTNNPQMEAQILHSFQCILKNQNIVLDLAMAKNSRQQATINDLVKRVEYLEAR